MPSPPFLDFNEALAAGEIVSVPLEKSYRLVNHGPTVLVSARHDGVENVMAAAWACGLDFSPPKVTVVIDKIAATRALITASGYFALQVPNVAQLQLTYDLGTTSLADDADKLAHAGAQLFDAPGHDVPLVQGCSAWLVCRRIPEAHIEDAYDLFVGEVVGAWANPQVFEEGHWHFDRAQPALRSLHYIAGGQFYAIGEALTAQVK
ncbi:flavin reductase family protein [Pseudomonas silvicola]|nr:flavin reductase family protein [Pseudomonas silvicola]